MSQQKKLEQILNLLVNEEMGQAEELLHELVIEKARYIYEELVNEEDGDEEAMGDSIGGDMKQGFTDEVSNAEDDIETDELQDGEVDSDETEELSTEERVEDLESQLEELRAEFEQLMSDELEEPYHDADDFAGDYSDEGGLDVDFGDEGSDLEFDNRLGEATNFSNNVSVSMDTEGKFVGAGKSAGATGTESPYTHAPRQFIDGADPVEFTKGNDKPGGATPSSKDETPSDNINATQKNAPSTGQEGTAGFVGTGKGSTKGAEGTKSPLTNMPRR
jgi:hypothetical protein